MPLRLLSINIDYRKPGNRGQLLPLCEAQRPDFVVLAESLPEDAPRLGGLFPHRAGFHDPRRPWCGVDVLSRHPLVKSDVFRLKNSLPIVRAVALTGGRHVEVFGVHLTPTLPHAPLYSLLTLGERRKQVRTLMDEGARLADTSLIAGDFNVTPWMPEMRRLTRRWRDSLKELGAARPTYRYFIPLRLDYILTWNARLLGGKTLDTPWTDHRALVLDFSIDPPVRSGVNYAMDIRTEKKDKWFIVHIEGRLDVMLSQQLESMVFDAIGKGELNVLFNLSKVEYMSSSGLRVFISTMRKLGEKQGEMRLCHMSDSVRKILKIVDLEGMFRIYANEEEALK